MKEQREGIDCFRNRLKLALDRKGWKPVDLVERTGVPKGAVSYYMAGKSQPKADRLYIIAQALDVNEAWLLGYDVDMARTDDQKKNDQLAQLVGKLRNDVDFFEAVTALSDLDAVQFQTVVQLLGVLKK